MTGRDSEPHHVGERTGPSVRDMPDEPRNLIRQNWLRADNSVEKRQTSAVVTRLDPFKNKPVNKLAREPNPNPTTRNTVSRLRLLNEIVERPIQVRQRNVNSDPSDRKSLRGMLRRRL